MYCTPGERALARSCHIRTSLQYSPKTFMRANILSSMCCFAQSNELDSYLCILSAAYTSREVLPIVMDPTNVSAVPCSTVLFDFVPGASFRVIILSTIQGYVNLGLWQSPIGWVMSYVGRRAASNVLSNIKMHGQSRQRRKQDVWIPT